VYEFLEFFVSFTSLFHNTYPHMSTHTHHKKSTHQSDDEMASTQHSQTDDESDSDESEVNEIINPYHPSPDGPAERWKQFFIEQQQTEIKQQQEEEEEQREPIETYQPTLIEGDTTDYIYGHDYNPSEDDFNAVTQNVHGIEPNEPEQWGTTTKILKQKFTDVEGITESNVDWHHGHIRRQYLRNRKKFDKGCMMETSSSTTRFNQTKQPGGTATILAGKHNGRVKCRIRDKSGMGRWSGFILKRSHDRGLAIITAYRVSQTSINKLGPLTAYHQQHTIMLNQGYNNPEPKKQCITDLQEMILKLIVKKCSIILMTDANESLDKITSGIGKLAAKCKLVDAHEYVHGINENIHTYKWGSSKIDHILVSADIAPAITKCGILPFDTIYESDHRALYVAFNSQQIFKASLPEVPDKPQRGLHSNKPKEVEKYTRLVDRKLKEATTYTAIDNVNPANKTQDDWPDLENIDAKISAIVEEIEQKIRSPSKGPWSPAIEYAALLIRYWRLWYRNRRRKRNIQNKLQEIVQMLPENMRKKTIKTITIKAHLRQAQLELRKTRIDSTTLRQEFLQEQAEAYAQQNNTSATAALNELIKRETSKTMYDNISGFYKDQDRSGIKRILIPVNAPQKDPKDLIYDEVTEPTEVQNRILQHNKEHFQQANGTPFAEPTLINIFGPTGTNQAAEDLYNGIIPELPDTLSDEVKAIIRRLGTYRLPEFECTIDEDAANGIFRTWRESTATSPSGRHLGHYKATLAPNGQPPKQETTTPGERIFNLYIKIMNIAINEGYSLKRWQTVISSMIEKIPGMPRIDKLRIIHIFEADYGAIGKYIFAGKMMKHAEALLAITDSQYGARKDRKTHDMLLLKKLKFAYADITKTGLATFDNDAKACYDRITVLLASLICRNKGVPKNVCDMFAQTLIKMIYYIQTGLGKSVDFYKSSKSTQLQGTGQGFAGSGPIWTMHFSIINECYEELATGTLQHDPTNQISLKQASEGFVDDAYLFANNTEDLIETLAKDAQTWEKLLHAAGGKLALDKCFYYHLEWKFDHEGRAKAKTIDEIGQKKITITESGTGNTEEIVQKECSDAHLTLGMWIALDGNQRAQKQDIEKKSQEMIRKQSSAYLTRQEAFIAHEAVYMSKIGYSLGVTYFTRSTLDHIHSKALQVYVPDMGYNMHFPRAVLHAP
jgi:hypothetical protein